MAFLWEGIRFLVTVFTISEILERRRLDGGKSGLYSNGFIFFYHQAVH